MILADRAQLQSEIERLVASHALHGSESLCKLLRYLGKQAIEHPGVPVKEYQIATEVFGRQTDFDPQLDSMVRVQAGRLRAKLSEYYSGEGTGDRLVVELPKGSYAIAFHERPAVGSAANGSAAATWATNPEDPRVAVTRSRTLLTALVIALILSVALSGWLLITRRSSVAASVPLTADAAVPESLRVFWKAFVRGPEAP